MALIFPSLLLPPQQNSLGILTRLMPTHFTEDLLVDIYFFFKGSPISWVSRVHRSLALSTIEAEYITGSEAAREAVWLKGKLDRLTGLFNHVEIIKGRLPSLATSLLIIEQNT